MIIWRPATAAREDKERLDLNERHILERVERWAEEHREAFVQDLISLVNIPSVSRETPDLESEFPFGRETARCVDRALEIGRRLGLEGENDGYYTVSFCRRGEINEELGLLSHLDVVPAGDFWHYEPFRAVEKDGHVIGRGASDNKGPCLLDLYLLSCLKELEIPLRHTVRVILGCNEEAGMADVLHYQSTHAVPRFTIVSDSSFGVCIGEKGILSANLVREIGPGSLVEFYGGTASNSVPDQAAARIVGLSPETVRRLAEEEPGIAAEQAGTGVLIRAQGRAGHAAFPEGSESAIVHLARFLTRRRLLTGPALEAVAFLAQALDSCYGEGLDIAFTDEVSGRTTCIGGWVQLKEGRLVQNINVRYSVQADQEELIRRLTRRCAENGYRVEQLKNDPPRYISPEKQEVRLLMDVCRQYAGEEFQTFVMGGGTHARRFPNAVPFGPGKRFGRTKFGRPHSADEAVCVDELLSSLKVYAAALLRLDAWFSREDGKL